MKKKEIICYDIAKELLEIKARMHGTNFEQDGVILSDAADFINEAKESAAKMVEQYQTGMNVHYQGNDESDGIECPVCHWEVARNDDFTEMRPKHCPECGTKLLY